jgi:lipopolysaccharide export system protein LptA
MERRKGMNPGPRIAFLFISISVFFFLISAEAQEKKGAGREGDKRSRSEGVFGFTTSRAPIDITSDTVEADQKKNTITFKGNVVARQEDTTLYANTLVIHYNSDTKKPTEIVALGNVKLVHLERRVTGQKATFEQEENKIVLDGKAVVREGENVIRGERITFYIDEEKSIVEGGKEGRVNTRITPPPRQNK